MKRVLITCNVLDGSICISGVAHSLKKGQTIELEMEERELKRISKNKYFNVKEKVSKPVPVSSASVETTKGTAVIVGMGVTEPAESPAGSSSNDNSSDVGFPGGTTPEGEETEQKEPKTLAELAKTKTTPKPKSKKSTKKSTGKGGKKSTSKKSNK